MDRGEEEEDGADEDISERISHLKIKEESESARNNGDLK
jgi:hypothetical protein